MKRKSKQTEISPMHLGLIQDLLDAIDAAADYKTLRIMVESIAKIHREKL